jgi:DNA-binding XRE family transcriptional regulator
MGILSRGTISIKNSVWDMAKPSPSHAGNPVLVDLGNTIRQIRLKKGYSQESVALACELDRSYFGGIERGEHNVAVINLEKIATALDVDIRDLFKK